MNKKDNYAEVLRANNIKSQTRGIWEFVGETPTIEYGWKLHVSSVQWEVFQLLDNILPSLIEYDVPFKIAYDSDVLAMLNEGSYGSTQIGKFMTIYPQSDDECLSIAKVLVRKTANNCGPKIVTDLHLGGTIYTRYGSFNPKISRDRLGNINVNGNSPEAGYKVPFVIPEGINNPFSDFVDEQNISTEFEGRLIGSGYLIVQTLNIHAKGTIYKALDLREQQNIRYVVLKEARKYCVSDIYGRHMFDRLLHQQKIHSKLRGKIPMPDFIDKFEFADNLYISLEFIEGIDYEQRTPEPFYSLSLEDKIHRLKELKQLSEIIKALHSEGVVHRDISPRNIRINSEGAIFLLDFELSHEINDLNTYPFAQGTPGYISPQQKNGEHPTFTDDIYSLGSVLMMILTGFDSQRVQYSYEDDELYINKIAAISGAPIKLCETIYKCLNNVADLRPSIVKIIDIIDTSINEIELSKSDDTNLRTKYKGKRGNILIQESLNWLHSSASQETISKLWFSPEIESHNTSGNIAPTFKLYRSVSRGVSGVIYALSRLQKIGYNHPATQGKVNSAVDWLLNHEPTADDQMPGLHFGEAGVAVAIAEAVSAGIIEKGEWLNPYINEALQGPLDWPDITHGAAGQGVASILCSQLLLDNNLLKHSHRCYEYLNQHQLMDGSWSLPNGVVGMEGSIYTGFAHGVAGIVYFLCKYALIFDESGAKTAAIKGGDWLLNHKQDVAGNAAVNWPILSDKKESWKWWCHGGPGISLSFLSLFELTKDKKYLDIISESLNIHPLAICYNNLSQCHGLSGLGEIYLDAFKITGKDEFYSRATYIVNILESLAKIDSNGASWLVENTFKPTADLMIGCSGISHFLARYHNLNNLDLGSPLMIY